MAQNYAYAFAQIDLETGMCIGVHTSSDDLTSDIMIPIESYNEDYVFKYYINGAWYVDAAGTIPFTP